MVSTFTDLFLWLDQLGVLDSLVPFLLIFTIIFAILQKSNILGKDKKNFNVIVALIISLAVVIPHVTNSYPSNADVVQIINTALPNISLLLVAIVMVLLLIGIFGLDLKWMPNPGGFVAIIAAIIVVFIFGHAAGWFYSGGLPRWLQWMGDPDIQTLVLVILVFGIIIYYITKDESGTPAQTRGMTNFMEDLGKMFGGGGGR